MHLDNRVVVVTGAASGIGATIAHAFGRQRAGVGVADLYLASAEKVAIELRQEGSEAVAVQIDVTDEKQVSARVASVVAAFPSAALTGQSTNVSHGWNLG